MRIEMNIDRIQFGDLTIVRFSIPVRIPIRKTARPSRLLPLG
jgi:hypothetical protein